MTFNPYIIGSALGFGLSWFVVYPALHSLRTPAASSPAGAGGLPPVRETRPATSPSTEAGRALETTRPPSAAPAPPQQHDAGRTIVRQAEERNPARVQKADLPVDTNAATAAEPNGCSVPSVTGHGAMALGARQVLPNGLTPANVAGRWSRRPGAEHLEPNAAPAADRYGVAPAAGHGAGTDGARATATSRISPAPVVQPRLLGQGRETPRRIENVKVTGYCNCFLCCGKRPGDKAYGITASGKVARSGMAAGDAKLFPFGTRVFVPNAGVFSIEDRGGAITGSRIDLWFPTHAEARRWGVQYLTVEVVK